MDKPQVYDNDTFHEDAGVIQESSSYDYAYGVSPSIVEEQENNPRIINNVEDRPNQDMTGSDEHGYLPLQREYMSLQRGNMPQ